jgi:hypothetical protein
MWWLLATGDAINSARVERVTMTDPGPATLIAWIDDRGYQLAGEWDTAEDARAAQQRLTNTLDASTL